MKRLLLSTMSVVAAFAMAPVAQAAVFLPGDAAFTVAGNIASGPVTATIGRSGITTGAFTDSFDFIINQVGLGSGTVSTNTTKLFSVTDLDISSVTINGLLASKIVAGTAEFFSISGVPISFGTINKIVVTGVSRGNGAYGGSATFTPSVPEPATWGMMLIGLGGLGATMRHRRRQSKIAYA
jgi:hypothetical protein